MNEKSRESERPAQSAPADGALVRAPGPPIETGGETEAERLPPPARDPHRRSRRRVWAARGVAIAADLIQIGLLPLAFAGAMSPADDVIDVATALLLTWLVGWHWAFLPTFVAELVPFVDLVPSWTLATFLATRGHDRDLTRS